MTQHSIIICIIDEIDIAICPKNLNIYVKENTFLHSIFLFKLHSVILQLLKARNKVGNLKPDYTENVNLWIHDVPS